MAKKIKKSVYGNVTDVYCEFTPDEKSKNSSENKSNPSSKYWYGLCLETSSGIPIRILGENITHCCETWGTTILNTTNGKKYNLEEDSHTNPISKIKNEFMDLYIEHVGWNPTKESNLIKDDKYKCYSFACVWITGVNTKTDERVEYHIDVWAERTIYYPHDYWFQWDKYEDVGGL